MMLKGAHKVMQCFGVKKGESVLIVVDTSTPRSISESLFECAKQIGCEVILALMLPRTRHGEEPPAAIAEAMKNSDVVIAPTTFSITHTKARVDACKAGARLASMPGITEKMMISGGMIADYDKINNIALRLRACLQKAREVRIITKEGTDILFDLKGCEWMMDTGLCYKAGCSTNLPAGEVYVAPKDANGVFVVDGAMSGIGILESPLEFEVRKRYVKNIKGKHTAKLLSMLEQVGENAYNIAELGIGVNPEAKIIGNVLEDEKAGGTVHIALGDNSTFGGDVMAGIHLDGILKNPKVFADGEEIILENYLKY